MPRKLPKNSGINLVKILRERIANHEYSPGEKLLEFEISREFKLSRTRVREAFGALESRGLIQRIPNRGAEVIRLDLPQMFAIYDVREVLEGLCVRLAVQKSKPDSWKDLVIMFGKPIENNLKNGEFEKYIAKLELLQSRTANAADNAVLADMLDSIYERTREIMRRIIILPGRAADGLKQHRAVLNAMCKGNAELAEKLKRENIRSSRECLIRYQSFLL